MHKGKNLSLLHKDIHMPNEEYPEVMVAEIKGMMTGAGRRIIEKEIKDKIEEKEMEIDKLLRENSSCILDANGHNKITILTYEKYLLQSFIKIPLDTIKKLDVRMTPISLKS